MSAPPTTTGEPITDKRQLVEYLAAGSKPPEAWRIGTEHEKFVFRRSDLRRVPYEGPDGIRVKDGQRLSFNVVYGAAFAGNQAGAWSPEDVVAATYHFQSGVFGSGVWCHAADTDEEMNEIVGAKGRIQFSTVKPVPQSSLATRTVVRS